MFSLHWLFSYINCNWEIIKAEKSCIKAEKSCVKHYLKCPKIIETLAPAFCWGLLCLWALPTPVLRQEGRERS